MFFIRKLNIVMIVFSFGMTACASLSGQEDAASRIDKAWSESHRRLVNEKLRLQTRYNPLSCDEKLKYEVALYGQFRHVYIDGDDKNLELLMKQARSYKQNEVFEYNYYLTDDVYTSSCGQQHYILRAE